MKKVSVEINGKKVTKEIQDHTILSVFIRENLNLTGTHVGCDTSQCGACVVHLNGKSVKSCTTLAADVTFFVSGSNNVGDRHTDHGGVALFGGNVVLSGSIIPGVDSAVDLGGTNNRFRNIYTGDLHLRNERGDWTIVEEREYLCVVNNITGKKYKMDLTPLED